MIGRDTLVSKSNKAADFDRDEADMIAARAKVIAAQHPEIAADVLNFAETQAAEYDFLDENFIAAIWVLKRSH